MSSPPSAPPLTLWAWPPVRISDLHHQTHSTETSVSSLYLWLLILRVLSWAWIRDTRNELKHTGWFLDGARCRALFSVKALFVLIPSELSNYSWLIHLHPLFLFNAFLLPCALSLIDLVLCLILQFCIRTALKIGLEWPFTGTICLIKWFA